MRASFRRSVALAVLAVVAAVPRAARADDVLEEQKKLDAVHRQRLEVDAREALIEAATLRRSDPARAVEVLKGFRVRLETDRVLTEARRKDLLRIFDDRLRDYGAEADRGDRRAAEREDVRGRIEERRREFERQERVASERADSLRRMSELQRQGKFDDAYREYDRFTKRHGRTPESTAARSSAGITESLRTMRQIENERDRRYQVAMRELVRSSMPTEGDIEFPKDWAEKTKRRLKPRITEEEKKLLDALNAPISVNLDGQKLEDAIEYLEKTTGINFLIDKDAMALAGVTYETTVKASARKDTTRTLIRKLFSNLGLTYVIKDAGIYVTTPERAREMMVARTYYVGDLVGLTDIRFGPVINQLQMIENIAALVSQIQTIEPGTWREGGGNGTIAFVPAAMAIVVKQSAEMHYILNGSLRP
jgi:hypothetical protein